MPITKKRLLEWQDAKDALDLAKSQELELRNDLCAEILKDKVKGTVHFKKYGLDAAATGKINVTLDAGTFKEIFKKLSATEKACIKYKPELINKAYKDLPEDSILHSAVSEKPGTPSFKLTEIEDK